MERWLMVTTEYQRWFQIILLSSRLGVEFRAQLSEGRGMKTLLVKTVALGVAPHLLVALVGWDSLLKWLWNPILAFRQVLWTWHYRVSHNWGSAPQFLPEFQVHNLSPVRRDVGELFIAGKRWRSLHVSIYPRSGTVSLVFQLLQGHSRVWTPSLLSSPTGRDTMKSEKSIVFGSPKSRSQKTVWLF